MPPSRSVLALLAIITAIRFIGCRTSKLTGCLNFFSQIQTIWHIVRLFDCASQEIRLVKPSETEHHTAGRRTAFKDVPLKFQFSFQHFGNINCLPHEVHIDGPSYKRRTQRRWSKTYTSRRLAILPMTPTGNSANTKRRDIRLLRNG